MATTFKVSTDQLELASNAFDSSRNKCINLARRIMNIAGELKGSWQGDAATAFYNKLQGIQGDINDINKIINEHVQDLREIANVYKQTEDTVKAQSSGLQSDVLSY